VVAGSAGKTTTASLIAWILRAAGRNPGFRLGMTARDLGSAAARVGPTTERHAIRSPGDAAAYLGPEMADLAQEQLRVVLLTTKNRIIGCGLVYQGGINAVSIRLADCFREAVRQGAAALILVHNHPSADPTPSPEDVAMTVEAARVGALLGIDVLDHLIIGGQGRDVSLRERGLFTPSRAQAA